MLPCQDDSHSGSLQTGSTVAGLDVPDEAHDLQACQDASSLCGLPLKAIKVCRNLSRKAGS